MWIGTRAQRPTCTGPVSFSTIGVSISACRDMVTVYRVLTSTTSVRVIANS